MQDDVKQELVDTSEQLIRTQAQRDRNALKLEQLAQKQGTDVGGSASNPEADDEEEMGVLAGHLNRIAALEKEVKRLKQVCTVLAVCGHVLTKPVCLVPSCVTGYPANRDYLPVCSAWMPHRRTCTHGTRLHSSA